MKAYSPDLRSRIVAAVDADESPDAVATRFGVHVSTVYRYLQRRKETGSLAPSPIPGRPPSLGPDDDDALRAHVREHPDATLEERCTHWTQTYGVTVSLTTMSRHLARLMQTRKKRPSGPASGMRRPGAPGGSA